uniref:Binding-protein-dependent transport systems inner membrane component n=1 Tax=uncultured bacterium Contig99 TaxID=1393639 RepID=W0FI70_9BACT|nr:binding-protein-dependent transport systems inner membrane component [uncultured bacterium Contig99]
MSEHTVKKHRRKWEGTEIFSVIVLTILAFLVIIPFWNALVISLETSAAYGQHPFSWLPGEWTLENYRYLFQSSNALVMGYKGTLIVTSIGTVVGMSVSVMAAYAFSRRFPGKKVLFGIMVFTMFFGGGLIPIYLQLKRMNLLNTYSAIILLSLISVYNIIIMKNGFDSIPPDLEEAAKIDGANDFVIFLRVMLPLQKPLIATFSLFTAVAYWNSWYWPLITFSGSQKTVLQLYLRGMISAISSAENGGQMTAAGAASVSSFSQGIKMSSVFMTMLPIMCVYPFLQKYFVKGILVGAVKM